MGDAQSLLCALMGIIVVPTTLTMAGATSCCTLGEPPKLKELGPPPRPPWLTYGLRCNGSDTVMYWLGTEATHGGTTAVMGQLAVSSTLESLTFPETDSLSVLPGDGVDMTGASTSANIAGAGAAGSGVDTVNSTSSLPGTASNLTDLPNAAESQEGSGTMSTIHILLLLVLLLLVTGIIILLVTYWYKKTYLKYQVSPVRLKPESNFLYNYLIRGRIWRGQRADEQGSSTLRDSQQHTYNTMDKKGLMGAHGGSHASLSNSSGRGVPPRTAILVQTTRKGSLSGNSYSSGIGMSQPDLHDLDESGANDNAHDAGDVYHRPCSAKGCLTQVEFCPAQPDVVKSTLQGSDQLVPAPRGRLLPILTPLRSSREPGKSHPRSRTFNPDEDPLEDPDHSQSGRRSSSSRRPLSLSESPTEEDLDMGEYGQQLAEPKKSSQKRRKKRNFLRRHAKDSHMESGDGTEVFANPYVKIPGIKNSDDFRGVQELSV